MSPAIVDVPLPDEIVLPPTTGPTPDQAAWIREHVWTKAMRKTFAEVPAFYTTCACEWGLSIRCKRGQHDQCAAGKPLRTYAGIVTFDGNRPAHWPDYFTHPTDADATGPRHTCLALVWLADRVCRWVCPCRCHAAPAPVQLDLFGGGL
ncbi:DUF6248 family natural product biosynthesis protein [Thermomonospora amylolytica]|uniref:DUF6248 family natural product biosynthesis protein n=1 Tax=Thermomonospora amylolytica TaxID=1411117 RepID=UPI000E6D22C3|nr:DUF6248 family natural product biosynthesis protein [Thermomonospora amylolytica]